MKLTTLLTAVIMLWSCTAHANDGAIILTDPSQLSPNPVVVDFENAVTGTQLVTPVSNPFVVGDVSFASLSGSLSIFDISIAGWPVMGPAVAAKTLFPGGEPDSAISITFASPVSEVLLGWGDPNFDGNVLKAFDTRGDLLQQAMVAVGPPGGSHAAWIGFKRPMADIAKVVVQPDQSLPSGDDYVIDNLYYNTTPDALLSKLVTDVIALNLQRGISNSFDAKLAAVMAAIDGRGDRDSVAAVNALSAFAQSVEAQRGKHLTDAEAELLVSAANRIIAALAH